MHRISQQHVDLKVRKPFLSEWKKELIAILRNPMLPDNLRASYQERLDNLGSSKVYRLDDPISPGALDPGPIPKTEETLVFALDQDSLSRVPRSILIRFAKQRGRAIDPRSTKAQVIEALISSNTQE